MTAFTQALQNFWSSFGVIAFQADMVPQGVAFPYITYETVLGAPFGENALTARLWWKDQLGDSALTHIAAFFDQVKRAIPPQGVKIPAGDGFFVLYPNTANFLSYEADPSTDGEMLKLLSGRVSYEIKYYL